MTTALEVSQPTSEFDLGFGTQIPSDGGAIAIFWYGRQVPAVGREIEAGSAPIALLLSKMVWLESTSMIRSVPVLSTQARLRVSGASLELSHARSRVSFISTRVAPAMLHRSTYAEEPANAI